jgi:hypothetical protein
MERVSVALKTALNEIPLLRIKNKSTVIVACDEKNFYDFMIQLKISGVNIESMQMSVRTVLRENKDLATHHSISFLPYTAQYMTMTVYFKLC